MNRRDFLRFSGATIAASAGCFSIAARAYPTRPVRVIVPFAAGGPNDLAARVLAQKLTERLGNTFYVENIGGAGGNIGTGQAAKAIPDGHTLLFAAPSYAVNPMLFTKVPYDPLTSFEPTTMVVTTPTILTVHPSLAVRTVKELVTFILNNPSASSYASPGIGTPPHLLGELFRITVAPNLVHIPFSGGGPAIASTVAGHTPISFGALPPAVPHVRDGKLRALAVTSADASSALPGVPTVAEAGYPDIVADIWSAVLTPAGTPRAVIESLHREISIVIRMPEVQERMAALGYRPIGNSPEDCKAQIAAEIVKWKKVIQVAGIKVE